MLTKVINALQKIYYSIDVCSQSDDTFVLKGWLFSAKSEVKDLHFVIKDHNGNTYELLGMDHLTRKDVLRAFNVDNSEKSGFYVSALVEHCPSYKVWVVYKLNGKQKKLYAGKIDVPNADTTQPVCITESISSAVGFNLVEELKDRQESFGIETEESVDIIVPVYNGYKFLDKLLETIGQTDMKYTLYLIDDKSPDERVYPFLKEYAEGKDNVVLLQNEQNLGFVQTVNRGLSLSENHVAIVNTDIVLPNHWLERLMEPVISYPDIATSTPYTTCGTICSFPEFLNDNTLFLGLDVDQIDDEFKKIKPKYVTMPTGVGFCMGMNKQAIKEVGLLDSETFGKGYGEENDWCQRAVEAGYRNVQVENLFVFHNHGGSFPSEEKRKLLEEHEKLLLQKHPSYNQDVARFVTMDPNRHVREFVKLNLLQKYYRSHTVLAFDHSIGGGATSYLEKKFREELEREHVFIVVRYDFNKDIYRIEYRYRGGTVNCYVPVKNGIENIISYFNIDEIWINELVTYPNLYTVLHDIRDCAKQRNIPVRMLFHDFFAVCPTINLLNSKDDYCGLPACSQCNDCLKANEFVKGIDYESMETWRKEWNDFLSSCNEVVVFSENTKSIVNRIYPELNNIVVIPHVIDYIPEVHKKTKTTDTLNVGLIGVLTKHKGEQIVKEMIHLIEENNLNIRIRLIGRSENLKTDKYFSQTGPYSRDSLPRLVLENDIDIFLIPSIWPETFSYTTEEVMTMGYPVMCFDIGAPAERISKYEKGIVIPEISAQAVLKTLQDETVIRKYCSLPLMDKKVLFVVEDYTYATRYRVHHLQEQLLLRGYPSECISVKETKDINLDKYTSVCIYRCSHVKEIDLLIRRCHEKNLKVYYDIDDFVFDYPSLQDLPFLGDEEYKDFEKYTEDINTCMNMCDGYIVSTNVLQSVTKDFFPGKPVMINRNSASIEMLMLSLAEKHQENSDKIILGYFSGSNTHNEDFEMIMPVILKIMQIYPQVNLLLGGQIQLPPQYGFFKNRIERFDFVDWKDLPALLSKADINLMPLQQSVFHSCKSENKWMEAALVGLPTIATYNEELRKIIVDGVDGCLCKDEDEWYQKLEKLVTDIDFRHSIAEQAHQRVVSDYTTMTVEEDVFEALTGHTLQ